MRHAHEAEPAPAVPPGICDGRVTNGQQSTDPTVAGGARPPETSRPDGDPYGGRHQARSGVLHRNGRSAARDRRGVRTGMEDGRGGDPKRRTSDRLRARRPYLNTLVVHQVVDSTPLLYIHRPILDKNFHNKHKSGGSTPEVTIICMGKGPSLTFPMTFFPYKKSAEVSPKNFS